jgi:EAL domain-containing protein (putative c-di-GMP-specific phosphodiesterase class I)
MMAMKELGVKFALDDFGSGLSSFSYLKNLPIDYLKIDGSLVRGIPNEEYDRAIVTSINEVAHLMGIQTIAEFVETDQILEHIGRISIDYAQGYITGKPVAIAA